MKNRPGQKTNWFQGRWSLSIPMVLLLFLLITSNCSVNTPLQPNTPPRTLTVLTQDQKSTLDFGPTQKTKTIPTPSLQITTTLPFEIHPDNNDVPQLLENQDIFPSIGLLINTEPQTLIIISPKATIFRQTYLNDDLRAYDVNESEDDCILLLRMSDAQDHVRLKRYNLISNKAEDIFDVFSEPGQSWKTHPEISPTGKWVSYAVWSGNFYYEGAEYQDLEILPIEGGNPQRLTTRGGTLTIGGAWSPKDDLIAFTDLDEVGVSQLFLNEITKGHIEQVTNFPDPDSKIEAISWSPIGDQLVFDRSLELREDNSSELWVMDLPTRKISRIDFQFDIFGIGQIFWNNSGNAIVASLSVPGEKDGMYWIDMDKKVVSHALMSGLFKEIDVFGYSFTHPFPISRDLRYLGFLTFDSAFMYDSHTKTIYRLAEIPELQDGMLLDVTPFTQNLNDCFDG